MIKKMRYEMRYDCNILHAVLLVIILLPKSVIICYLYTKKTYWRTNHIKITNNEF